MTLSNHNACIVSEKHAPTKFHEGLTYYPAYCYKASPTYFKWVKLSTFEVHHVLVARTEFQTASALIEADNGYNQNDGLLLFYLNHPIQFIQAVGVVVTFEDYFEKFWVFNIDDSSGSTIEVTCRKPPVQTKQDGLESDHTFKSKHLAADESARIAAMSKITIGTMVQVKGRVTTFRSTRQIRLERVTILRDTNQEMQWISAKMNFMQDVLSKCWILPAAKQKQFLREARGEVEEENDRIKRRRRRERERLQREIRHARSITKDYEYEEEMRYKAAEEAMIAGRALHERKTREGS